MKVKTSAKINLALDVTGKLPNGYHKIESVFQTIGLYDEISVEFTDSDIELTCEKPDIPAFADDIPCDGRNIAYKAAKKFIDDNNLDTGCRICIKKGIPSQAGMGGGSTDAAAVLYCLAEMTGGEIIAPEKLGADVPFFLTGGTAYVTGIGENVRKIADCPKKILVIAKGSEGVSTIEAYRKIDLLDNPAPVFVKKLVNAIENGDNITDYIGNIFEQAVNLAEVDDIKQKMLKFGAETACMTGSGSAVFGIFNDMESAEKCHIWLTEIAYFSRVCETVTESIIIQ